GASRACTPPARRGLGVAVGWPLVTWATVAVNPTMFRAFATRPLAWLAFAIAVGGMVAVAVGLRRGRAGLAFIGSSCFLAGLLGATAASVFPVMLRAVPDPSLSITAFGPSHDPAGLRA